MKRTFLILLVAIFIFSGCEMAPEDKTLPENNETLTVYDLEIGKFPGEKYTTFYHVPSAAHFPKDEYDPLDNQYYAQNYMLKYANKPFSPGEYFYEFNYNNNVYEGKEMSLRGTLDVTAPYKFLGVNKMVIGEEIFYGVELWLDSGEVKSLYYDEIHKMEESAAIPEESIKQIVNAKAAEYIEVNKYEVEFDFEQRIATYHQKIGDLYLSEPFNIRFAKDGYIYKIDFNKSGDYDEIKYDIEFVKNAINEKFESINNQNFYTLKSIDIKNVDVCKYGVVVVVSDVRIFNNSSKELMTLKFYTKISD